MHQHRLDAAAVWTLLGANRELDRLDRPALAILGIGVVLADHRHRAERQACVRRQTLEPLGQQVRLFTRQKRRQHSDNGAGILRTCFLERAADHGDELGPRLRHQLAFAPHHRPGKALDGVDIVVAQPAVVAHEIALRLLVFARPQTVDDVFVAVEENAATRRAVGTDTVLRLEVPDAVLVEEVLATQGTDGAQVHHVARQLVVERLVGKDVDFAVMAAVDDLQFGGAADLAGEADAARAHDAAVGEQGNVVADVRLVGRRVLVVDHAAVGVSCSPGGGTRRPCRRRGSPAGG